MFIGILQFELLVRASTSLKDKRRVVRSVKDRLHRQHLVSVAEIAALDHPRLAVMALTLVSNSRANVEAVLDRVVRKLQALTTAELGAVSREILSGDAAVADDEEPLWTEHERRDDPPTLGATG